MAKKSNLSESEKMKDHGLTSIFAGSVKWLVVVLVSIALGANAQATCACSNDFLFVSDYLEHHYSGFATNVTPDQQPAYQALKARLAERAKQPVNPFECLAILKEYTRFFKDNHLSIVVGSSIPTIDETSDEAVRKFKESDAFTRHERLAYDSAALWQRLAHSTDPVEGIYEDETYQVAVLRDPNAHRDYSGIITQSKTPLWEKGQVKLTLKRLTDSTFGSVLYMRNHLANPSVVAMADPIPGLLTGSVKIFPAQAGTPTPRSFRHPTVNDWFYFAPLDDQTNYLYIGTFNGSLRSRFDSAYRAIKPVLLAKPHLIVDVRDNGGGSDGCWQDLARLLYTQPYPYDQWEVFASSEVIKRYQARLAVMRQDSQSFGPGVIDHFETIIKKLTKARPGTFVSLGHAGIHRQAKIYHAPAKVIVMFNRQSASAAEGFVLAAMRSQKVLTFGENSGGYISYGNIMSVDTPSGFRLNSATNRVLARTRYEQTGIPPQVRAVDGEDWVEQARRLWGRIGWQPK
ncbi:MAG: S41 family peptidase [Cyclobacteriaceae bacterium]|jgi:hypothetical protein|nr:S41 family peptidase [Cyclobacteriaceae bacterium]